MLFYRRNKNNLKMNSSTVFGSVFSEDSDQTALMVV
jgi:hypothetical protein